MQELTEFRKYLHKLMIFLETTKKVKQRLDSKNSC